MAVDQEVFGRKVGQEAANLANSLLIHPIQHDIQSHIMIPKLAWIII
jgi:hypothetical protein